MNALCAPGLAHVGFSTDWIDTNERNLYADICVYKFDVCGVMHIYVLCEDIFDVCDACMCLLAFQCRIRTKDLGRP
jgi:hypothetical protein